MVFIIIKIYIICVCKMLGILLDIVCKYQDLELQFIRNYNYFISKIHF